MEIDPGEFFLLDMDTVEEAPFPDIYIGRRRRKDPGPPTTEALAKTLSTWQAAKSTNDNDDFGV